MSRVLPKRVSTTVGGALPKLPVTPVLQMASANGSAALAAPSGNSRRLSELPSQRVAASESEHIQVCVRIRPGASASDRSMYQWSVANEQTQLQLTEPSAASSGSTYRFNRIFDVASSTMDLYAACVRRNIAAFCEGFNGEKKEEECGAANSSRLAAVRIPLLTLSLRSLCVAQEQFYATDRPHQERRTR